MCGIFAIFLNTLPCSGSSLYRYGNRVESLREMAFRQSGKQRHRGPDHTVVLLDTEQSFVMVHEKLALRSKTCSQPYVSQDGTVLLMANGEVYNYLVMTKEINDVLQPGESTYVPRSDCDVILAYYERFGVEALMKTIRGMFAFVLYDKKNDHLVVARDPMGIISLYNGTDTEGNIWVASEMKCLVEKCPEVKMFPPGHIHSGTRQQLEPKPYYTPQWMYNIPTMHADLEKLKTYTEEAVISHLQVDAPISVMLSGGLDSSLIASIATKVMRERHGPAYRLKTYSVGLTGGPDFEYAQMVADYIGSDHTEVYFTVDEGLNYIREAIFHSETYDISTIRSTIPLLLLARFIKSEGIKIVFSGDGSDDQFGGYLNCHQAHSPIEFHEETVKRMQNLCHANCLRADKATAALGLEIRVPFLDTDFVNYVMNIRPEDRMPQRRLNGNNQFIEKYILREAFTDGYLPTEVLWRQKEQFSDGVGYSWINSITEYAALHVSDMEFAHAAERFPINPPTTKEGYYYRQLFEELFPHPSCARIVQ